MRVIRLEKTTAVNEKGQIVIPKEILSSQNIKKGDKLLVNIKAGRIEIRKIKNAPNKKRKILRRVPENDPLRPYAYKRLIEEGEDAEELIKL